MSGQMCWLANGIKYGKTTLHLRLESHHPWKPYTLFPGIAVRDYNIPRGSKGWATFQKLLKAGWTLIPTVEVRKSFEPKPSPITVH
jgi:hypothetical protein